MLDFLVPFDPMRHQKRGRAVVQPQQQDQYQAGRFRIPARQERSNEMNSWRNLHVELEQSPTERVKWIPVTDGNQ